MFLGCGKLQEIPGPTTSRPPPRSTPAEWGQGHVRSFDAFFLLFSFFARTSGPTIQHTLFSMVIHSAYTRDGSSKKISATGPARPGPENFQKKSARPGPARKTGPVWPGKNNRPGEAKMVRLKQEVATSTKPDIQVHTPQTPQIRRYITVRVR